LEKTELTYLGHIISQDGVASDPEKTTVMHKWPIPGSMTKLLNY
jgi:hypothetical protein